MPLEGIAGIQVIEEVSRVSLESASIFIALGIFVIVLSVIALVIDLVPWGDVSALPILGLIMGAVILVSTGIYVQVLGKQPPDVRVVISEDADIVTLYQYYEIISEDRYTVIVRQK